MFEEKKIKFREKLTPIKCKINFITLNEAEVPLRNHTMMLGAIYDMFTQVYRGFSRRYHSFKDVKPWSFSLLKFDQNFDLSEKSGFYKIKRGIEGYFYIKTVDPEIYKLIKRFTSKKILFQLGKLTLNIENANIKVGNLKKIPKYINMVKIRFDTPTYFYRASMNLYESFNAETFLNFQCEKFKRLGIMHLQPEQLYPYVESIYEDTHESWGYLTDIVQRDRVISLKGISGDIIFEINGNRSIKELIWKILYISEYTGIGTRSSMGFGHNSIISVK